jgi:hypothetical protein
MSKYSPILRLLDIFANESVRTTAALKLVKSPSALSGYLLKRYSETTNSKTASPKILISRYVLSQHLYFHSEKICV